MRPLQGRRILITRARHQSASLAGALEEQGAEVLAIPTIEIVPPASYAPLDQALADMQKYGWLILTSVNGVEALARRLPDSKNLPEIIGNTRIVAIGPATARALAAHLCRVEVVPPEYVAESLVKTMQKHVSGERVLLVRAEVARDVIPLELTRAGATVEVIDAYRTVVPEDSCAALRQVLTVPENLPHAVSFTSSSTVTNFFRLLREAGFSSWPCSSPNSFIRAASIGPITSRTLREHGVEPAVEAKQYTIPGLVDALCQWAISSSHGP